MGAHAGRDAPGPRPAGLPAPDLERLKAEATYHRNRVSLYRARMQGPHPTDLGRLRELEQTATAADERLAHARRG